MKKQVKIGVIGTGFARLTQIPAFLNCEDTQVVSVASANLANAEKTAAEFGIGHFTDNWRETARREDIDLLSITTPPNLHHEMTLFALEHDKHVLCEKPMAMNTAEAEEMALAARGKGLLALIDHELRFLNGRQKAREMIRDGKIGKVFHFKQMFRNASRGKANIPWNWWSDIDAGGGALGAIGSHAIDGFHWFLDTEITDVFCFLKTNVKERMDSEGIKRAVTADDETNIILKFADSELTQDSSGTVSLSVVEAGKYDFNCKIFGTEGSIIVGESGELWFARMGSNKWDEIKIDLGDTPPNTKVGGWSRGFMSFSKEIVSALKEGRTQIPESATFEDGVKVQKVLDACRESDRSGEMTRIV
ncbi:MAG: Gfo/Idh/MocA family oxidoreductase [Pyrinomonadaceae bacterium]|nr:Gfo/Idh/MocA family oxidoreductase [Pyrinomonadaceae bacterium]